ncbi:MAG: hypothetical protein IJ925_02475 [Muribaculaceae bacterium]|jgi:hypothetical protein|nr:hypothetical protein [Prevotella sp.]MBR2146306.1 hypothetical protein [Muribaculaceae bacterium]
MTASFNTSFFSTPATAASGVSKKGFRSTAYNNYVVDVIDFDNEIHTFEVEASTADEASEQAAELAMSQGTQVSYCNVYCEQ